MRVDNRAAKKVVTDHSSLQVELATQVTRQLVGAESRTLQFQVGEKARFYGGNFELSIGRRIFFERIGQEALHVDRSQLYAEPRLSCSPWQ